MTDEPTHILASRCGACHGRFLPRAGPCPRCGSLSTFPESLSPVGVVLAATELLAPSAGWASPHRLVLVELDQSVRVLCRTEGPLPEFGTKVKVTHEGETYRCSIPRGEI